MGRGFSFFSVTRKNLLIPTVSSLLVPNIVHLDPVYTKPLLLLSCDIFRNLGKVTNLQSGAKYDSSTAFQFNFIEFYATVILNYYNYSLPPTA